MRRLFEMKYIIAVASLSSCLLGSCGLMDTTSEEHLSGDEMWDEASVQTVEGFVNSIYTEFRTATMQKVLLHPLLWGLALCSVGDGWGG